MTHPIDVYVGQRVRFKRKMMHLTQSDLAKKLNLTFQQVQKYEKGDNRISASKLYQIAEILKTSVSFFFEGYQKDAGENNVADLDIDRDSVQLVQAFHSIKNTQVRKRLMNLMSTMKDESGA